MKLDLVIDTNVTFDLITRFDIHRLGRERYGLHRPIPMHEEIEDLDLVRPIIRADSEARLRITRARCGLALCQYLHSIKAQTYSLKTEVEAKLEEHIPPGIRSMALGEVAIFVNYLKDAVFYGWHWALDEDVPKLLSHAADQHLVDVAKKTGAILLSNEGLGRDLQPNPKKGIRKKAATAGVEVLTTVDYISKVGADVRHFAQAAMMRIWYFLDRKWSTNSTPWYYFGTKPPEKIPWARLYEYNILANWNPN